MRSLRLKRRLRSSTESAPANQEAVDYESPPARYVLTPSYQMGLTLNCRQLSPTVKKAGKIRAIASPFTGLGKITPNCTRIIAGPSMERDDDKTKTNSEKIGSPNRGQRAQKLWLSNFTRALRIRMRKSQSQTYCL